MSTAPANNIASTSTESPAPLGALASTSNMRSLPSTSSNPAPWQSIYHDPEDDRRLKEVLDEDAGRQERKLEHPNSYTTSSEVGLYSENTGRRLYTGPTVPRGNGESLEDFRDRTGQNSGQSPRSTHGRPLTPSRGHYAEETPTSRAAKENSFGN